MDMVRDILRARNPALLNGLDELIQDEAALSAALLGGESDDEGGGGSGGGESGRPVPHSPRSWEVANSMPTREDAIRSRGADVLVLDASPGGDNTVSIGYETRALSRGHNSPARASVGDEAVSVASDGSDAEVASDSNACVICLDAPKSSIFLPVRPPLPPLVAATLAGPALYSLTGSMELGTEHARRAGPFTKPGHSACKVHTLVETDIRNPNPYILMHPDTIHKKQCCHKCVCDGCGRRVMKRTRQCPVCRASAVACKHVYE